MAFNSHRNEITCCHNCTDRHEACWGSCEKYKKQREAYDKKKAELMKQVKANRIMHEYTADTMHKMTKRKNYRSKYRRGH